MQSPYKHSVLAQTPFKANQHICEAVLTSCHDPVLHPSEQMPPHMHTYNSQKTRHHSQLLDYTYSTKQQLHIRYLCIRSWSQPNIRKAKQDKDNLYPLSKARKASKWTQENVQCLLQL